MRDGVQVFSGRMYRVGLIRYVDVPARISVALQTTGPHLAVSGSVEGLPLRTTMVSRGKGCHRIAIHGDLRKKLQMDAGAIVEIVLERDEESHIGSGGGAPLHGNVAGSRSTAVYLCAGGGSFFGARDYSGKCGFSRH